MFRTTWRWPECWKRKNRTCLARFMYSRTAWKMSGDQTAGSTTDRQGVPGPAGVMQAEQQTSIWGNSAYEQAVRSMPTRPCCARSLSIAPKGVHPPLPPKPTTMSRPEPTSETARNLKIANWPSSSSGSMPRSPTCGMLRSYVKEARAFEEFAKIVEQLDPHAGSHGGTIIRNISGVIETVLPCRTRRKSSRRRYYESGRRIRKGIGRAAQPRGAVVTRGRSPDAVSPGTGTGGRRPVAAGRRQPERAGTIVNGS